MSDKGNQYSHWRYGYLNQLSNDKRPNADYLDLKFVLTVNCEHAIDFASIGDKSHINRYLDHGPQVTYHKIYKQILHV